MSDDAPKPLPTFLGDPMLPAPDVVYAPGSSHYERDEREIEILRRREDAPHLQTAFAAIRSYRSGDRATLFAFSTPRLTFTETPRLSRAEWERAKREIDAAFDAFEKSWPLSEDAEPEGGDE